MTVHTTPAPAELSYYEAPARIFLDAGVSSGAVRRLALAEPEFGDLLARLADAMDELEDQDDEDQGDEDEPYCAACGASIGVFIGYGTAYLHYTGAGTAASPVELYDAGHEPVIAWRPAVAR